MARKIKDKESTHGRNKGSGATQGRTKVFLGTVRLASMPEEASPKKKEGKEKEKKKEKTYFRNGHETKQKSKGQQTSVNWSQQLKF